jgi:small multidrug resistance pump
LGKPPMQNRLWTTGNGMKSWIFLLFAIVSETIATSALKSSEGFTKFWPSILVIAGYGAAFYLLAQTLRAIPLGVAYTIWSGVGIVLITLVGWLIYDQKLDAPTLFGIGLIASGIIVMNVFSSSSSGH